MSGGGGLVGRRGCELCSVNERKKEDDEEEGSHCVVVDANEESAPRPLALHTQPVKIPVGFLLPDSDRNFARKF